MCVYLFLSIQCIACLSACKNVVMCELIVHGDYFALRKRKEYTRLFVISFIHVSKNASVDLFIRYQLSNG